MKKNNKKFFNNAFTLTETLITVVILGIVAAILVPNLIKNQVENANRTKVKKAMASYEKAINYMIIENDIRSTESLRELGQDNCQYTRNYFKTIQDGSNNCIFKTADRVWWDITDITNPIIILNESLINETSETLRTMAMDINNKTVFALVGRFDDLGILRVNDNAYETDRNEGNNKTYVTKLWYFIGNIELTEFMKCKAQNNDTCTVNLNGENITYTKINMTRAVTGVDIYINKRFCIYNRETKKQNCNSPVIESIPGEYYIKIYDVPSEEEAKSEENCASSIYSKCLTEGDYYEAAKRKCESQGARLPNSAELKSLFNQNLLPNKMFWASEEAGPNDGHDLSSHSEGTGPKNSAGRRVVCVGI